MQRIGEICNLGAFGRFLHLCAGRVGQIANLSALGAGVYGGSDHQRRSAGDIVPLARLADLLT